MCAPVDERAPGAFDEDSIPFEQKKQAVGLLFVLVDSKGIEPSNLTDANRALSQLSYEPIFTCLISDSFCIIAHFSKK